MNKKGFLGIGVTDIFAYIFLGVILLVIFLFYVFIARSPSEVTGEAARANFEADETLIAYLESPFVYDTNGIGAPDTITIGEFLAIFTPKEKTVWEDQTNRFFNNLLVKRPWGLIVWNPDKTQKYTAGDTRFCNKGVGMNPEQIMANCGGISATAYLPNPTGPALTVELRYYAR